MKEAFYYSFLVEVRAFVMMQFSSEKEEIWGLACTYTGFDLLSLQLKQGTV